VKLVFAAAGAVFFELQLIRGIDLVFFGKVVLGFADGANESKNLSGSFFGHTRF